MQITRQLPVHMENGFQQMRQEPNVAPPPSVAGPASLKSNILIVDDRPDKLLALEAIIAPLGQNIIQARSGKEALRLLLKHDFAVILLDVSMPGMDGFETASLIRQRLNSEHTPIIFITAVGDSLTHVSRGYSLGAVDYLLTPILPDVLRSKVSAFVELHKKTELVRTHAAQLRSIDESRHQRELAEVVDRLERETQRNRFFLLALDLLAIGDLDGRLLQTNPAWYNILGLGAGELARGTAVDLVDPADRARFSAKMSELRCGTGAITAEIRFLHKDGSVRWLDWNAVPFAEENLIYIFARDITARRNAESQVHVLNQELEQRVQDLTMANRELEAFNYSIAHDLRSPLRTMSGFAEALLEDESDSLSSLGADYSRRIARSAKFMDTLLLDLLNYSSLGRAEMPRETVDLDELIQEMITLMQKEITDLSAQVETIPPLGRVYVHPPTLKQIISNLMSNSLKFTSLGKPPMLRIFSSTVAQFTRLWFEDNGIGIAPEHHERIFGLFNRLHDANTYPGTGIGLALVRKGAERLGGRAGVESQPGEGSRFWVDLMPARRNEHG
jgi:PAS domain S-box-containing protein